MSRGSADGDPHWLIMRDADIWVHGTGRDADIWAHGTGRDADIWAHGTGRDADIWAHGTGSIWAHTIIWARGTDNNSPICFKF